MTLTLSPLSTIRRYGVNTRSPALIKVGIDGTGSMMGPYGSTGKSRIQVVRDDALPAIGDALTAACIRGNDCVDRAIISMYGDVGATRLGHPLMPPTPISRIDAVTVPDPCLDSTVYAPALRRFADDFKAETKPDSLVSQRMTILLIDGFDNGSSPQDLIAARDELWAVRDANGDSVLTVVICLDIDGMGSSATTDLATFTGLCPADLSGGAKLCAELASPAPTWITETASWKTRLPNWKVGSDNRLVFNPGNIAALTGCLSAVIASSTAAAKG